MFLASEFYKDNEGSYPDIAIYLSLHAINRRADHIEKALNVLRINESDSVVSVQEEREPMFGYSKGKLTPKGRVVAILHFLIWSLKTSGYIDPEPINPRPPLLLTALTKRQPLHQTIPP